MDVIECIEKGLLKQIEPDKRKMNRSIQSAKNKLIKARKLLEKEFYEDSVVKSYSVMFHAARALLFRDGFAEKSHYGLYVYISERYRTKLEPKFISELDSLRLERHDILYALEEPSVSKQEALDVLKLAQDFIKAIEIIL